MIITMEDPSGTALIIAKDKPYYRAYSRELAASFRQARRVDLDKAGEPRLSAEPTIEEARKLFTMLELPRSFTDRDVSDVITKALKAKNPYW